MNGILSGLTIIEGSAFVAAPLGGMTLAQLGANVIRFDMIGGGLDYRRWPITKEGRSLYWPSLNKGKKSIAIDIRNPKGQELIHGLIAQSKNFLTNFPARGWLDYDVLKSKTPDLVMINVQGNPDGSSELDYTVNCAAGFPDITGPANSDQPVNHVLPAWDVSTGLYAALSFLAADRHRAQTGDGQLVQVALSDVAFATAGNLGYFAEATINNETRPRIGNDMLGSFGRDFPTKDGRRVMIVAITIRQWTGLLEATGTHDAVADIEKSLGLDFSKEGDRYHGREQLFEVFGKWCAAHDLATIRDKFDANGVCWGPYRTVQNLLAEDPRASTANPVFGEVTQPGIGTYLAPGSPLRFGALEKDAPMIAPSLGQHTDEVISGILGLPDSEIGRLHDEGVIAGPDE